MSVSGRCGSGAGSAGRGGASSTLSKAESNSDCSSHSSLLLAPGFGARPLGPPVTPLTASLNFLTDVVIRWLTGLGTGPPEEAAFGVLGLLGTAFAMGTVLRRPLVAAAPPKGLLLIAMPGVVLVTVRPFLKTEPASA